MKKQTLLLLLLLVATITITGCKKDKDSATDRLQGRWNQKSFIYEHYVDGKSQQSSGNETPSGYIVFTGNKFDSYQDNGEHSETGTFTLIGDKLTVTSNDVTLSVPIKWISNDEFSMTQRYDISLDKKEYEVLTSNYVRHK
ncbi:MAG: hypothetical protein EOO43_22985 [Flavobacterium sp.]|nr:MAG: hypothetical protein EOO43_22985 [Flavobacterium sp.]